MFTNLGYGDSATWGGREPADETDSPAQIKAEQIENDEGLQIEAVYAYLGHSQLNDLDEDEYSLFDKLFSEMPTLKEKATAYYSEVLAKDEAQEKSEAYL